MMALTLIKSDCYIAVAFDHFSISLMGKKCANNLHKREFEMKPKQKNARAAWRQKLADNFIVKREFVIIVDHIFCFLYFMLCFMLAYGLLSSLLIFFAIRNVGNLWFQWFIYCVWLFQVSTLSCRMFYEASTAKVIFSVNIGTLRSFTTSPFLYPRVQTRCQSEEKNNQ